MKFPSWAQALALLAGALAGPRTAASARAERPATAATSARAAAGPAQHLKGAAAAAAASKAAQALVKQAEKLNKAGKHTEAIEAYQRAYDLAPGPLILFGIAGSYRLAGDGARALEYYRKFLDSPPPRPTHRDLTLLAMAQGYVKDLEARAAQAPAGEAGPSGGSETRAAAPPDARSAPPEGKPSSAPE